MGFTPESAFISVHQRPITFVPSRTDASRKNYWPLMNADERGLKTQEQDRSSSSMDTEPSEIL
jgi:hypothetical protein